MRTLLLLRHAKSDWSDPELADHDRPLNQRGKRNAERMGRLLKDEELLPDLILTSTATRARETVKRVVSASGYAGKVEKTQALYLADPAGYVATLREVEDEYSRVMVVGHNPGLEELAQRLTGTAIRLPTAALVQIAFPLKHWRDLDDQTEGQALGVWRPRELS
jgi:phosphohistidine phosphatase